MSYRRGIMATVAGLGMGSAAMVTSFASPAAVHLLCTGAAGVSEVQREAACAALAETLGRMAPSRAIRQDAAAPEAGLVVTLHVTQTLPRKIGAVLSWRDAETGGTSPEIALRAVDAGLSPEMYRSLAGQLIAAAELPL